MSLNLEKKLPNNNICSNDSDISTKPHSFGVSTTQPRYFSSDVTAPPPLFTRDYQEEILKEHLRYVMQNSSFYKKHFKGIDIETIDSSSLSSLPLTNKTDFEKCNGDFLACSQDNIVDIVHSSGTSGHPTYVKYTENDLKRLEYNEVQALTTCGISKTDTVLLTCTMDRCFIAGLAYLLGCRGIGAAAIRNGANTLESHLRIIKDIKPNVIIGVPSFLQKLAKFAKENGIQSQTANIEKLVCIGEPLRDAQMQMTPLGKKIESLWNAKAYSTYASTETVTSFCECEHQKGGHLIPELGIVEIIDDDGRVLPIGETGEVIMTPFHTEGMPLVRYRTGDMAFIIDSPCECGRNSLRLSPILGRKYQMIKCKGTKFYPTAINAVMDGMECVKLYQVIVEKDNLSDKVIVLTSLTDMKKLQSVKDALRTALRVGIDVETEDFDTLFQKVFPANNRKPVKYMANLTLQYKKSNVK
jgi:phenylacetate-CoA ligase